MARAREESGVSAYAGIDELRTLIREAPMFDRIRVALLGLLEHVERIEVALEMHDAPEADDEDEDAERGKRERDLEWSRREWEKAALRIGAECTRLRIALQESEEQCVGLRRQVDAAQREREQATVLLTNAYRSLVIASPDGDIDAAAVRGIVSQIALRLRDC